MKYETFEALITACETEYERKYQQDKSFEKLFGGDTQIISDNPFLDRVLDIMLIEYPDAYEDVFGDFIYRVTPRDENDETWHIDGADYKDTIRNLWLYCEGKDLE